jgi:hypothetical protein
MGVSAPVWSCDYHLVTYTAMGFFLHIWHGWGTRSGYAHLQPIIPHYTPLQPIAARIVAHCSQLAMPCRGQWHRVLIRIATPCQ